MGDREREKGYAKYSVTELSVTQPQGNELPLVHEIIGICILWISKSKCDQNITLLFGLLLNYERPTRGCRRS